MKKISKIMITVFIVLSIMTVNALAADSIMVDGDKALSLGYTVYGRSPFRDGLAAVIVDDGWTWNYIDENYEVVDLNKGRFTMVYPFLEGLAAVIDNNDKLGFINKSGDIVIPCEYGAYWGRGIVYAGYFKDGVATVYKEVYCIGGQVIDEPKEILVGKINKSGKIVQDFWDCGEDFTGLYTITDSGYMMDEYEEIKDIYTINQSTLRFTSWRWFANCHGVYYEIKNEQKSDANTDIIDTSRYAIVKYSPLHIYDMNPEIHFLVCEACCRADGLKENQSPS